MIAQSFTGEHWTLLLACHLDTSGQACADSVGLKCWNKCQNEITKPQHRGDVCVGRHFLVIRESDR